MFKPVCLFIGLRYTRAKRRNHFISFISWMAMLGIALGIAVLMTVLSVMNGFDEQIKEKIFAMVPQVTVSNITGSLKGWQALEKQLKVTPGVQGVAPVINGEALLTIEGATQAVLLSGVDPKKQDAVSVIPKTVTEGSMASLIPGSFHMVIGEGIANRYRLGLGSEVTVITPSGTMTPLGFMPRFKRFTVSGIFHAGGGFDFDNAYVFVSLQDAATLYQLGQGISALRLTIDNPFAVTEFSEALARNLPPLDRVDNWTSQFGAFFHAIALEKQMMFFILMLIIAIAAFNLVSTLVMVVSEKSADIAILRTLGATPKVILGIFVVQGAWIGLIGTLLGVVLGLLISYNVTAIANFLQALFHVQFISSSVYIIDYLPSKIQYCDVVKIALCAWILSLLATLYPAWRASRVQIIEALRYE